MYSRGESWNGGSDPISERGRVSRPLREPAPSPLPQRSPLAVLFPQLLASDQSACPFGSSGLGVLSTKSRQFDISTKETWLGVALRSDSTR